MPSIVHKVKENLLVSVVSVILTGALLFVGTSFISLQNEVNDQIAVLTETQVEVKLLSQQVEQINSKLDIAIQNQTSVDFMKSQIRSLESRVHQLERE